MTNSRIDRRFSTDETPIQFRVRRMTTLFVASASLFCSVTMAMPGLTDRPSNSACVAPERPFENAALSVETVATQGVSFPVEMLQSPDDPTRWYVVDRSGYVAIYQAGATFARIGTLIDISSVVQRELDGREWAEMGLLGMAFHPNFAVNGEFFLYYSADGTGSTVLEGRLARFTSNDGGMTADPLAEDVVLRFDRDKQYHWGGRPTFGTDGLLYMSIGDGGTHGRAQNLSNINGKMIRIDVDGGSPYAIPENNPFAQGGGLPEIYAYGFRNPWRWSFDSLTGEIWEGDVGPSDREEINIVVRGGNYGWSLFQGTLCHLSTTCDDTGLLPPVLEYTHDSAELISGDAVIGGFVYRGTDMPGFYGHYIFGDSNGKLFGFDPVTDGPTALLADTGKRIFSFAEDRFNRELFALAQGEVLRISQAGDGQQSDFPQSLASSECVANGDPTQPASGLIPYDVNVKLWSDEAEKNRWMAVPDNTFISVNSEGHFDYPAGTILIKEFRLNQKRIETRWLVRHEDGQWAGYTFEWDDLETDATLVPPEGKQKLVGSQTWTYPSRSQCLSCHTDAAGRSLGPEIAQLNGDAHYPLTGITANQLETLEYIGMFDAPLPDTPANLDALPDIADTTFGLEERARAYLHANCAMCHRPDGPGQGPEDFRYFLPTSQIGALNQDPTQGDLGVPGAKLIVPGSPASSIMLLRMQTLDDADRMPPLASAVVDSGGTQLVSDWIESMPTEDVVDGKPVYDANTDKAVFVWREGDGSWRLRATAGGASARYTGLIDSTQPFAYVTPDGLEPDDILDTTDPAAAAFRLRMAGPWQDGIDFAIADGASTCVDIDLPTGASVQVGATRVTVQPPFNLPDLGPCGGAVIDPNGAPTYDASTEKAVLLWRETDGSWRMRATAGGETARYTGRLDSNLPFSYVTPIDVEPDDLLDISDPAAIAFRLWMMGPWQDGIDFAVADAANVCVDVQLPAGASVQIGAARVAVQPPFNLNDFGMCP